MPGFLLSFFKVVNSFNFGLEFIDFGSILSDNFSIDASFEGISIAFSSLGLISDNVFSELSGILLFTFSGLALFTATAILYRIIKKINKKKKLKASMEDRKIKKGK